MHCNLRPHELRQPFPALIWRRAEFEVAELIHCRIIAFLLLIHYFTLWTWPMTCDLDLWHWAFAAYRLWYDKTLYQIWTQSSNPRRSYCDFNVWPYDLEHVLSVVLGSGIIFTKFDLRQFIRVWITAFFMLVRYVKRWPCSLTCWPWKFVVHQVSRDQGLYEIWAKSSNPRLHYW